MARRYDHIREKAIQLRTEQCLTLDEIVERLKLPRTTIYSWIKDIPVPGHSERQRYGQKRATAAMQAKFAALREAAYQQGIGEAPALLTDLRFRDFVVLYMAEGSKRNRNVVEFVNSDAAMVKLANHWISGFAANTVTYRLQYHVDHDVDALKRYWAGILSVAPDIIGFLRKSNSGQLAGRQFRSEFGLMSIRVSDTYLRARLQAWMDVIKVQW